MFVSLAVFSSYIPLKYNASNQFVFYIIINGAFNKSKMSLLNDVFLYFMTISFFKYIYTYLLIANYRL